MSAGRQGRPDVWIDMRLCGAALIVLAGASLLAAVPVRAQTPVPATNVDHVRRQLDTPSPLRDTVEMAAPPTFRTSVSEDRIDIGRFWGEPDAVSPLVHPSGGPWHHEYVNMSRRTSTRATAASSPMARRPPSRRRR